MIINVFGLYNRGLVNFVGCSPLLETTTLLIYDTDDLRLCFQLELEAVNQNTHVVSSGII